MLIGAAALVSALALPALVLAAQPSGWQGFGKKTGTAPMGMRARMSPGVFGTIIAMNGGTFTVESHAFGKTQASATWTVATDASTTYKKDGQAASSADLAVGESVMAIGTRDESAKTVAAKEVAIDTRTAQAPPQRFTGTIQSIDGGKLTILDADGKTRVVAAFSVGEKVVIAGAQAGPSADIQAFMVHDASKVPALGMRPMMNMHGADE